MCVKHDIPGHDEYNCWTCLWPPCVADADIIFLSRGFFFLSPFLWSPYGIGLTIIFLPCGFFFLPSSSFFFFFSSPNLSRRRLNVCHTYSTHGVALGRISDAGLKHAARGSVKIQNAKKSPKISILAPSHNFVGLYLCN